MDKQFADYVNQTSDQARLLMRRFMDHGKQMMLRTELWELFKEFCGEEGNEPLLDSPLAVTIHASQEAVLSHPWIYLAVRSRVARWEYIRIHVDNLSMENVTVSKFLCLKEQMVSGHDSLFTLEVDLGPFGRGFPRLRESRSIGRGVEFLNRKLSSELFIGSGEGSKPLLEFLRVHQCQGVQLMLNGSIKTTHDLRQALRRAEDYLETRPKDDAWDQVRVKMEMFGFQPGWGRTVERMRYTLRQLLDILEAPDPSTLETFLGSIPMIFNIVIISPHGYFGQKDVLGLPDTGGQVVYILDQVRALEKEMRRRLSEQGLSIEPQVLVVTRLIPESGGTTCDQRMEKIEGTQNARILRVPFRYSSGEMVNHWISRFEVWPFLERFALEVEEESQKELSCRPDLIIGNYSDGNIVASLLSGRLGVTQCNIAHALEKTKYLYSDLFWRDNEEKYHFSCQFTADLIAMNTADFIITSTYQEIAGKADSVGQYESYGSFTMPGLYRVVNGIDMFDPKFNIVSPGADSSIYFPYSKKKLRMKKFRKQLDDLIFGGRDTPDSRGSYEEADKPIIFTMARLDHIKNIAGFVQWYALSKRLRELANILVIGGKIDPDNSNDAEEREQIKKLHHIIDEHSLEGHVRWLGIHMDKKMSGELYRRVADSKGAFVQPALFEAFGLTVIEAMVSGLPTFATCFGGPLEIIENGVSGFHIDPNNGDGAAKVMVEFFERTKDDPSYWNDISRNSVDRVMKRYTWELYAERMMTLSRVYGFWKFVTNLERDETRRYLEMLYGLQFRTLAQNVPH